MILYLLLWSCIGIANEVFFTSIHSLLYKDNLVLKGYTYLWMFPIYALLPLVFIVTDFIYLDFNIFIKGVFMASVIMLSEYLYGFFLKKYFVCPWEKNYLKSETHIHGLIRYDYFPLWYFVSIFWYYLWKNINITKI